MERKKRGGARAGAGRKAKLDSEKRARVQLYLLPSEKVKVLSYIEKLRAKKAP